MFLIIIFRNEDFVIERKQEFGGNINYEKFEDLESGFAKEEVHPGDLKNAVEMYLNRLLDPVRKKFDTPELKALTSKAYPSNEGKTTVKKGGQPASAASDELSPSRLNIKVGKIVEVSKHPEAEALYIEKIDLGEGEPRTIVSGLVNFVPIEEMKNRMVVVLCNLKPAKLKGVESKGMVLCASRDDPKEVEPLSVPEGCQPGDKCLIEGYETGTPDEQLNPKKKVWEKLAVDFKTSDSCIAQWQSNNLVTPNGPVFCKTVKNAPVK